MKKQASKHISFIKFKNIFGIQFSVFNNFADIADNFIKII